MSAVAEILREDDDDEEMATSEVDEYLLRLDEIAEALLGWSPRQTGSIPVQAP